jgi:ATP synthase F0 subunit b
MRLILLSLTVALSPALFASGDSGHESPQKDGILSFSGHLMFWEYLAFGLIVLVVGWKVIPVMLKQLADRQNNIKDALDKADQVRAEAEVLLKKHEEMMRSAHNQAQKITDDAKAAGREAAQKIQQAAEAASNEVKERSAREIELMRQKAQAELREQAVELALLAGSSVLERSLTGEDHRRLAKEAIDASAVMKN